MTFRVILVPTDFSSCARAALELAADLSGRYGARLHFIHVVKHAFDAYKVGELDEMEAHKVSASSLGHIALQAGPASFTVDHLAEGQDLLRREMHAVTGARDADTTVTTGEPFVEIIKAAREVGADLIVMGTHGRTGLAHAFFGSVAERVVRNSPCPVMTVRIPGYDYGAP